MLIYHKMNELLVRKCYAIAELVPDHVLENIFSYLDLADLRNCSVVCKSWYRIISDENNDVWRVHCMKRLQEEVIKSDLLSSVFTYKTKLRAFYHAWNPHDCSRNIYIKSNGFTLHRYRFIKYLLVLACKYNWTSTGSSHIFYGTWYFLSDGVMFHRTNRNYSPTPLHQAIMSNMTIYFLRQSGTPAEM